MQTALIIIHVIISIALIAVVLMQHGKQQGLSGAIAGGAETFFGKNKGRTIDAMLRKVTSVIAILFVVSSVVLAVYSIQTNKDEQAEIEAAQTEMVGQEELQMDAEGNLVDADGNILVTAEEVAETEAKAEANAEAEAE